MPKLGLFTKLYRNYPWQQAVRDACDLGYDALEWMGRSPHLNLNKTAEIHEIKQMVKQNGLSICAIALYECKEMTTKGWTTEEIDKFKRVLEIASYWECHLLRFGPSKPSPQEARDEHWYRATEVMQQACELALSYGIEIGLEMHAGYLIESPEAVIRLIRLINLPNVGIVFDPANLICAGLDYKEDVILKIAPYLRHVHIKDIKHTISGFQHQLLGRGDLDLKAVLRGLLMIEYEGTITVESHVAGDPRYIAEHERKVLLHTWEELV